MKRLIAPSILAADFNHLGKAIEMINQSKADYIHFDVMDGVFVPNISFGLPVIESVGKIAQKPLDVHLMIVEPDKFVEHFVKAGASILTVHYEACQHLHRTIQHIKNQGIKASVCLNPHTPISVLEDIIPDLDMVLLMSVNPGFGGQQFIQNTYKKVSQLKKLIEKYNPDCLIEVDGGVNFETGKLLFEAGANVLVAGSFVFNSENPVDTISKLKSV
ncbi:MAG: ribulose-phosphate 3-epimerase [Prolixibacteraceae bacterium]|jgi:ribulose-phosphate 3-epimerase|nr:ribulose-phosphate 3-epimerase [Prolixibacteraceae bacterium]MBT6006388.1 ribulose-phosphate 3-epimerase [Prolixibacteraceae bacterium]MBT6765671.1 ribulose-phosphate 3-epimerase [Prolixibacteraceae bacterium]MBT6999965.1 ribulose-phosphate 3-epimerase [Prolixibacteraceae bacterium]MBT7396285.1 ribulose-phosphate 3-epimerase [Prolixibacteraceae bacterium]